MRSLFLKILLPLFCIGVFLFWSAQKIYLYTQRTNFLQIKNIEIDTTGKLTREEVLKIVGNPEHKNLLAVNLLEIKQKLENEASIYSANVTRILPDTLKIAITPEIPVAIVNFGKLNYLNQWGEVFDSIHPGDNLRLPFISVETSRTKKGSLQSERMKYRLQLALEILEWSKHSKWIQRENIGDIFIRNGEYDGMSPLEITLQLPNNAEQNSLIEKRYASISFGDEDITRQLQRLELVLSELSEKKIWPKKIRMELDKKVVVKIAQ